MEEHSCQCHHLDHPDEGGGDRGSGPLHPPTVPDQLELEGELHHNLKKQTSLNALTDKDVETVWLPL